MDIQEYQKLTAAIKLRDFSLPQEGIEFKCGDFSCEMGRDASDQLCLWARDTKAEYLHIRDLAAIYLHNGSIRDASMPADRIWKLIEQFPLK